jgi:hypothetical protein
LLGKYPFLRGKIMKALLIVLGFLGLTLSAQAGVVINKALDGSVAICDANTKNPYNSKVVRINLDKLTTNDSDEDATLAVTMVKCVNGQWEHDTEPNLQKYIAPNGKNVTVTMNNYELIMMTQNNQVVLQTSLDYLNKSEPSQKTDITLKRTRAPYQDFVIFIRFVKTVEAEGYKETSIGTFGEFVVRISNDEAPVPTPN